jgi:hypothetical protein
MNKVRIKKEWKMTLGYSSMTGGCIIRYYNKLGYEVHERPLQTKEYKEYGEQIETLINKVKNNIKPYSITLKEAE